jgi:hypothetical protein
MTWRAAASAKKLVEPEDKAPSAAAGPELLDRPRLGQAEILAADKRAADLVETYSGGIERSARPLE